MNRRLAVVLAIGACLLSKPPAMGAKNAPKQVFSTNTTETTLQRGKNQACRLFENKLLLDGEQGTIKMDLKVWNGIVSLGKPIESFCSKDAIHIVYSKGLITYGTPSEIEQAGNGPGQRVISTMPFKQTVIAALFSDDGNELILAFENGSVKRIDLNELDTREDNVHTQGETLGTARIWKNHDGQYTILFPEINQGITYSTHCEDRKIRSYDLVDLSPGAAISCDNGKCEVRKNRKTQVMELPCK